MASLSAEDARAVVRPIKRRPSSTRIFLPLDATTNGAAFVLFQDFQQDMHLRIHQLHLIFL